MTNSNPKKGKDTSSPTKNPACGKCGKKYYGDCLKGTNNCFACGKIVHKVWDFPNMMGQYNDSGQDSGSNDALKKNHFYALRSMGEKNTSPDVVAVC